jgi:hypothetical protein
VEQVVVIQVTAQLVQTDLELQVVQVVEQVLLV